MSSPEQNILKDPGPAGTHVVSHGAGTGAASPREMPLEERAARDVARVREMALSDVPGALALSERLMNEVDEASRARTAVLAARAHALCYANRFEPAVELLGMARELAESRGETGELGPLWLTQVQPLARLGRLGEAAEAARRALDAFVAAGQTVMGAKARVNLGIVLRMLGRAEEALACFDEARADLPDESLPRGMLQSNRAEALLDLDRFDEARAAFEGALSLLTHAGHDHAAAVVEGNIADLLSRAGDIDAALPRFDRAVLGLEKAGAEADAARLLAEEADALLAAGAHRKARRLFERALPVLRRAGLAREACRAMIGAGVSMLKGGDARGAAVMLEEGVVSADASSAGPLLGEARLALAEAFLACGDVMAAQQQAREAERTSACGPLFGLRAQATLAGIDLRSGHASNALLRASAGLARCHELGSPALAARLGHLHAAALAATGDRAGASAAFRGAIAHAERRRVTLRAEQLRTAFLDSAESLYLDAFSHALDGEAHDPSAIEDAFAAAAMLKARTLHEHGPASDTADPDDAAFRACVTRLNTLYKRLGPVPKAAAGDDEALRAELAELELRLDRLQDRRSGGNSASQADTESPLRRVQSELAPDAAVIVYCVDGAYVSALVVTRERCTAHRRLASLDEAAAMERRLAFEVDREHAAPSGRRTATPSGVGTVSAHAPLRRVYDAFVAPLVSAVGDRTVYSVGCRAIHALPLTAAAAMFAGAAARDVCMTPSMARRPPSPQPVNAPRRTLVIGVADEAAPSTEHEALGVARLYSRCDAYIGRDATAEGLFTTLPHADLVHFAGHGVFDADFPMSSRLKFADRWVAAREFRGRLRPGAVVVLSGCETGQMAGGEDRYGLARALLGAGASCVVGSLWRLHDAFALRFFIEFHAEISRLIEVGGASPAAVAACLGEAQRREASRGTHWSLWGGLFVKGVMS